MEQDVTLLIVDDSEMWRSLIKRSIINIMPEGNIIEAENGIDGLDKLRQNPQIKIIVTDVSMPVMNGIRLVEKVKANPESATIPIIMLTSGYISPEYTEYAKKNNLKILCKDNMAYELREIIGSIMQI